MRKLTFAHLKGNLTLPISPLIPKDLVPMKQVLSVPAQLGPLLKAARRNSGLSQQELARRLGMSQSRVSHMELNPGSLSLDQLLAISALLGLELAIAPRATGSQGARTPPAEW
jgi:HTH-type transcriptional regulator/antitoxin HipB